MGLDWNPSSRARQGCDSAFKRVQKELVAAANRSPLQTAFRKFLANRFVNPPYETLTPAMRERVRVAVNPAAL
jgi:hypothetical protein